MPKPAKFIYQKKEAFRDVSFFVIVCEGEVREPQYFRFFEGMSSRLKLVIVEPEDGSSPNRLQERAITIEEELKLNAEDGDKVWFVIDTDRWGVQLHELRKECKKHTHWEVVQSNPCFEVWLYFHALKNLPEIQGIDQCGSWKPYLNKIIKGGFNSDVNPASIEQAIINSSANYKEEGYSPLPGSTQVWKLAMELLPLIQNELNVLKDKFSAPDVVL